MAWKEPVERHGNVIFVEGTIGHDALLKGNNQEVHSGRQRSLVEVWTRSPLANAANRRCMAKDNGCQWRS